MNRKTLAATALISLCLPLHASWAQEAEERAEERVTVEAGAPAPADDGLDLNAAAEGVAEMTNAFRKEHGLKPLEENAALNETAQYFAQYMGETDKYGHGADGQTPAQRAEEHGYDYCIVLENIGYAYNSFGFNRAELAEQFYEGWRDSPPHRENMLDPDVTETGLAIARSDKTGVYYAVQMFGLRTATEFKVTNNSGRPVEYRLGEDTLPLPPRVTRTHTVCRAPELRFSFEPDEIYHPLNGSQYIVQREQDGLAVVAVDD